MLFNLPISKDKDVQVDTTSDTPVTLTSWVNGRAQKMELTKEEVKNLLDLLKEAKLAEVSK